MVTYCVTYAAVKIKIVRKQFTKDLKFLAGVDKG